MNFTKLFPRFFQRGRAQKRLWGKAALRHIAHLENAFPRICEMIINHVDLRKILSEIAKECLHCIRAHRTTIFIMDPAVEILKEYFKITYSFDQNREQAYQKEEEEMARKSFKQDKPLLLDSQDLPEFFPVRNPAWELTSVMTFPIIRRSKPIGILSAVSFNGNHGFDEERFRLFSGFARLISIAVEMADLLGEIDRKTVWRRDFERHLEQILTPLNGSGSQFRLGDNQPSHSKT